MSRWRVEYQVGGAICNVWVFAESSKAAKEKVRHHHIGVERVLSVHLDEEG